MTFRDAGAGRASSVVGATAVFSIAYAVFGAAALALDSRTLAGESVWLKPLRFGISTAMYLATLLWAMSSLSASWRHGQAAMLIAVTGCACSLFELMYIGIQAGRGQPSHFHMATPFYAAMYSLMAAAAVALVLCGGLLGILTLLDDAMQVPRSVRWGTGAAFLLSSVLTILTGLTMGGRLTHHAVVEPSAWIGVPLTGWSLVVGDLRIAHFLGMHLMQAGPLFAMLTARLSWDGVAAVMAVGFCAAWSAVALWIYRAALAGKPLLGLFH